jgi:hypothetical protein
MSAMQEAARECLEASREFNKELEFDGLSQALERRSPLPHGWIL